MNPFLALCLAALAQDFPVVPAPDGAALDRLNQAGAVALPIAANTNVVSVNLSMAGAKANDGLLELLKPLAQQVVWLNLAGTAVSDAGLVELAQVRNLQRLHLERTTVTDAGLLHLKGLSELRYLNLYGTKVSDAGLSSLRGLSKLQSLYLWQTSVTDTGEQDLQTALPGLRINRGIEAPVKVVEEQPAAKILNAKCPVSGKDVDADETLTHEGLRIGFCCADCKSQFEKEPARFIGKVEGLKGKEEKEPDAKKAINVKCPWTGYAVDPAHTVTHKKQLIGFCSAECKENFEKDPAKVVSRIPEFKEPNNKKEPPE